MKKLFILFTLTLLFSQNYFVAETYAQNAASLQDKKAAAKAAAEEWVKLLDARRYSQAYREGSPLLHNSATTSEFILQITRLRKLMGAVISRKFNGSKYFSELPATPDGDYVIIRFNTRFTNKAHAVELITPHLEKDGTWKISGYVLQ